MSDTLEAKDGGVVGLSCPPKGRGMVRLEVWSEAGSGACVILDDDEAAWVVALLLERAALSRNPPPSRRLEGAAPASEPDPASR